MATLDIAVPDIGDFDEVTVIELLVKPGDTIKADQSLLTVESDKASMEIPSSAAGVVKEVKVKLGDKVKQGSVVLVLESTSTSASASALPGAMGSSSAQPSPQAEAAKPSLLPLAPAQGRGEGVPASGSMDVHVPDIGDFKDVTVIEVLVKVGDSIKVEQSLVTVESDKASMEIPSSGAGVLKDLKVKLGDKINIGDLLAVLEGAAATSVAVSIDATAAPAASAPAPVTAASAAAHNPTAAPTGALPHASPSVRKFARELGVPLAEVKGAGPKGRITLDDVQAFTKSVMAGAVQTVAQAEKSAKAPASSGGSGVGVDLLPWPKVDFTKFGPIERKEMGRIKKISGANLLRNAIVIPAVTNFDDADITDLEAFRVATNLENEKAAKSGVNASVKVTMLAFLIKACVSALKKFPDFNASIDGDAVVYKQYFHIAFAADTPNGLVVPVIRDCDKKGVMQISQEMGELAKKARDGKLSPAEMQGACFTISSLGGIGGRYFTPIINAPEVAILGVCKSAMEPVWDGKVFQPRLMLPLSLTWDHRVIDGAAAARFNAYLGQILSDFRRVLL
ncbi:MAG: dihydrolipoyllysine-residue acetyltransferase [Polaromonas sp.]|jgi:pyruvate dehydrogenase E2 component (dihydrolipoamide acetyltransferase)